MPPHSSSLFPCVTISQTLSRLFFSSLPSSCRPVWWVTHVRDSDSPRQHYLTVPDLLTFFHADKSRSVSLISKGPISSRSAWAAVYGNRPLYSNTLLFGVLSQTAILVYHPTTCAHIKCHGTHVQCRPTVCAHADTHTHTYRHVHTRGQFSRNWLISHCKRK